MQYVKVGHLGGDRTYSHTKGVAALSFSPNGEQLASAGLDAKVCIWKVADGRLLHTFCGSGAMLSLVWSSNGRLLCGTADGNISVLNPTAVGYFSKISFSPS